MGYLWVQLSHQSLYTVVVGDVAQVDDKVFDVAHSGFAIFQQGSYVLQEHARLPQHVTLVNYFSFFVDACGARDEVLMFV